MHVEAVGEEERGVGLEVRRDLLVHGRLHLVRQEERHDLGALHSLLRRQHREAFRLGCGAGRAALAQADLHLDPGVAEVERVRVTLASVADHGDLAGEQAEVAVAVNCRHSWDPF